MIRRDNESVKSNARKLVLKLDKKTGKIIVDNMTTLEGIPLSVIKWMLKSKTPLEWVLEFYKDSKNKIKPSSSDDENIRKEFTTYKFSDHKEQVIKLLDRITNISVKTVDLREKLKHMEWGPQPTFMCSKKSHEFKKSKA